MMTQNATDFIQVVSFNIINSIGKKEDYAIPIEQVREIRAVDKITKVPSSESYVKGIMNLRGLIIPVIDVKEKLGLSSGTSNSSKQRILVAEVKGALTGLLVDEVDQVMRLQTKDIEQAPPNMLESHNYIKGIAKINEKLVILLDASTLLNYTKNKLEESSAKINTVSNETKQTESIPKNQEQTENSDIPTDAQKSLADIPPELAEVFKEDEEGIPPTQIIREAETISDI
jgi:purine-binding chemotaxis protein CheW